MNQPDEIRKARLLLEASRPKQDSGPVHPLLLEQALNIGTAALDALQKAFDQRDEAHELLRHAVTLLRPGDHPSTDDLIRAIDSELGIRGRITARYPPGDLVFLTPAEAERRREIADEEGHRFPSHHPQDTPGGE